MRKFLTIIFFIAATLINHAAGPSKDFVVVIDPGHGGKDYGAIGDFANEKSINLAVAKRLGDKISKSIDGVKVVYTRSTDVFIPLNDRAKIANSVKGDLFISIHVNSVDKKNKNRRTISGAEVYTLGLHRSEDNLSVAQRENSVMMLESDYTETYRGFNPNSVESYIAFELSQSKHMDRSIEFAAAVESQLIKTAGRADKGVRQAGFWVLWATSMPSVLVELDFICNPTSEKYLASEEGTEKLATALYNAFAAYHSSVTGAPNPVNAEPVPIIEPEPAPATAELTEAEDKQPEVEQQPFTPQPGEIEFRVQIVASDKQLRKGSPDLKNVDDFEEYRDRGLYKYTVGHFATQEDATPMLKKMRKQFPSAFIIKMKDGCRIYD